MTKGTHKGTVVMPRRTCSVCGFTRPYYKFKSYISVCYTCERTGQRCGVEGCSRIAVKRANGHSVCARHIGKL